MLLPLPAVSWGALLDVHYFFLRCGWSSHSRTAPRKHPRLTTTPIIVVFKNGEGVNEAAVDDFCRWGLPAAGNIILTHIFLRARVQRPCCREQGHNTCTGAAGREDIWIYTMAMQWVRTKPTETWHDAQGAAAGGYIVLPRCAHHANDTIVVAVDSTE